MVVLVRACPKRFKPRPNLHVRRNNCDFILQALTQGEPVSVAAPVQLLRICALVRCRHADYSVPRNASTSAAKSCGSGDEKSKRSPVTGWSKPKVAA